MDLLSNSNTSMLGCMDGLIVTERVSRGKRPCNVGQIQVLEARKYFKDKMLLMEAKEKGATLDAEAEAFLADVDLYCSIMINISAEDLQQISSGHS
ncbi:hypothetical protein Tco_1421013 [Tanacetum coccineum]